MPDRVLDGVRFYSEREWRYVPSEIEDVPAITREDLADAGESEFARSQVENLAPLTFGSHAIHYLIVKSERELVRLASALGRLKHYLSDNRELLKTRIVSVIGWCSRAFACY